MLPSLPSLPSHQTRPHLVVEVAGIEAVERGAALGVGVAGEDLVAALLDHALRARRSGRSRRGRHSTATAWWRAGTAVNGRRWRAGKNKGPESACRVSALWCGRRAGRWGPGIGGASEARQLKRPRPLPAARASSPCFLNPLFFRASHEEKKAAYAWWRRVVRLGQVGARRALEALKRVCAPHRPLGGE